MPHQCVRCGKLYQDGAKQRLEGCDQCRGRFFFFIKQEEMIKKAENVRKSLSEREVQEMEEDVRGLVNGSLDKELPVILDLETVHMLAPGKYEIDVTSLMRGKPVIINVDEGKYFIDLFTLFNGKDSKKKSS